jgi:hypothetical protein
MFNVDAADFRKIPGSPFAYWVSHRIREKFGTMSSFGSVAFLGKGPDTGDDFRFLRTYWEVSSVGSDWIYHPKGGAFSRYCADVHLVIDWKRNGAAVSLVGNMRNLTYMFRPGLTWSRRTTSSLSMRAMPAGCIFADKGPACVVANDDPDELLSLLAITNSRPFSVLVELQLAAADAAARSYEVGVMQKTPIPSLSPLQRKQLAGHARRFFSRTLDTVNETSKDALRGHRAAAPAHQRGDLRRRARGCGAAG